MLGHSHYHHDTLRNLVVVFGRIFDGLKIHRTNDKGEVEQIVDVPVSYGPKEKWLARIQESPDLTKKSAITLPRIGFEMTGLGYDPSRKLQTMTTVRSTSSPLDKSYNAAFAPVPYNVGFNVYIVTKTTNDALQLVEQILPFFTPGYTATLEILPDVGVDQDVPIIVTGTSFSDSYEGSFEQRREIIWTISFEAKCALYGPTDKKATILETIMTIDPQYGDISRLARSKATYNETTESYDIADSVIDVARTNPG